MEEKECFRGNEKDTRAKECTKDTKEKERAKEKAKEKVKEKE